MDQYLEQDKIRQRKLVCDPFVQLAEYRLGYLKISFTINGKYCDFRIGLRLYRESSHSLFTRSFR